MFAAADRDPSLAEVVDVVAAKLESLEPGVLSGDDAATAVRLFARLERLAAAGRTLVATRVAECGTWKRSGERSVAHWLARETGSSVSDAKSAMATARRLGEGGATEDAMRSGELSAPQAAAIAEATAHDPGLEAELLDRARIEPLDGLRRHARAASVSDDAAADRRRHSAQLARRSLRHWTDTDGMGCTFAKLPPLEHAEVVASLAPFRDAAFRAARLEGRRESYEAYAADGLVEMARAVAASGPVAGAGTGGKQHEGAGSGVAEEPSVEGPGAGEPGAGEPGDHAPDAGESGEEPSVEGPGAGEPGAGEPGDHAPDAGESGDVPRRAPTAAGRGRASATRARRRRSADATVIVRIDHAALLRGHTGDGETCEVAGVGRVPVASVRELIEDGDPFLAAVVTKGVDVCTAAHLGRQPSAHQRTASVVA